MDGRSNAFCRFNVIRLRILSYKQNEIVELEEKPKQIDDDDSKDLLLGNQRHDRNGDRTLVLEQLEQALASYDHLLAGNQRIRSLPDANKGRVEFLKNWTRANPDIGGTEVAFLDRDDLMTLAEAPDEGLATLEPLVEQFSFWLRRMIRKGSGEKVAVIPRSRIKRLTRSIIAVAIIIIILLTPIVILNIVTSIVPRFVVIFVSATLLGSTVTAVSKVSMAETFVAGAIYSVVLVVFVAGNGITPSGS